MVTLDHILNLHVQAVDKATKPLKVVEKQMDNLNKKSETGAKRFMGLGFSFLFMGMAMNRAITGFINSAINAFKIAGNEQSIFNVKTQELTAAWEFFKFSLIDALNKSDLFVTLIGWVISLVDWFGQLKPSTKVFITISLAVGAIVTSLMSMVGQLGLFLIGIEMVKAGAIATLFRVIAGAVMATVRAFFFLSLALITNPVFLIIAALTAIIILTIILTRKYGSFINFLKIFGVTFLELLTIVGGGIIELIILPLRTVIKVLNSILGGLDAISRFRGGKGISFRIQQPDFGLGIPKAIEANVLSKLRPSPVMSTQEATAQLKQEFEEAFKNVMPDFEKAIEAGNDKSSEKKGRDFISASVS